MASRDEIYAALRNADAAGDSDSVQKLGAYLKTMPSDGAAPAAAQSDSPIMDRVNAFGTGVNRAAASLLGLPVDAAMNAIDLGKAAAGSAYIGVTGKPPPDALQLKPRNREFGSSEFIFDQLNKTKTGADMVNAQNPAYQGGYLQAAGAAPFAVVNPGSRAELAQQVGTALAGTLGAKAAGDEYGPAGAVLGALAPHGAAKAATAAAKYAVRGGEAGRQAMEQRVADLNAAGISNPTLGLASGSNVLGGIENLLSNTPGAIGVMRNAREAAVNGLQAKTDAAAAMASGNRGAMESGSSIQKGAASFKEDTKARTAGLYDNLDQFIDPQTPVGVANTKNTLAALNSDIKGAPQLSRQFKNSRIMAIEDAINADTAGSPASVQVVSQPPRGAGGMMNPLMDQPPLLVTIPPGPPRNTLPFEAVKKIRTVVGNEIADNNIMSDVPRSKWNPLYGALSEDMRGAAAEAGPQASDAFNRASDYTRASIGRLDQIAPIVNKLAPEQTFQALNRSLAENTSTFQAVKKSLPDGARGDFAGTVIERLGKATPGQQDSVGSVWSPETFLTNWNRMAPKARDELLSGFPNSDQVRGDIQKVADATSLMRANSKIWANPSGTGANVAARGTLGAIALGGAGAALGAINPLVPLGAAGTVAGANLLARGLTSKTIRDAMLRKNSLSNPLMATDAVLLNQATRKQ